MMHVSISMEWGLDDDVCSTRIIEGSRIQQHTESLTIYEYLTNLLENYFSMIKVTNYTSFKLRSE